jgi:rubredoxin
MSMPIPRWFARLYVWIFRRVPTNALCPACGHRKGKIRSVTDGQRVMVEHECLVCGWGWQHPTVLSISPEEILDRMKAPPEDKREAAFFEVQRDGGTKAARNVDLSFRPRSAGAGK